MEWFAHLFSKAWQNSCRSVNPTYPNNVLQVWIHVPRAGIFLSLQADSTRSQYAGRSRRKSSKTVSAYKVSPSNSSSRKFLSRLSLKIKDLEVAFCMGTIF